MLRLFLKVFSGFGGGALGQATCEEENLIAVTRLKGSSSNLVKQGRKTKGY